MPQHIPHFGFETTPEISAAEREAVSTRPDSALQRAIRATQQSEEFYTPGQLLMMGPQAFNIAREAELGRRKMLVDRAQQGINLSNIAISHRGTQRKHDARRREEEILSGFIERTRGMDQGEAMSDMTAEEASSPLTMDFLRKRDEIDVLRSALPGREFKRRQDEARLKVTTPEQMEKEITLQNTQRLKNLEDNLSKLSDADLTNPNNYVHLLVDLDPPVANGIHERIQRDPEAVRPDLKFLAGLTGTIGQAEGILGSNAVKSARESLAVLTRGWSEGGEIDFPTRHAMAKLTRGLESQVREMAAFKESLSRSYEVARARAAVAKLGGREDMLDLWSKLMTSYTALNREQYHEETGEEDPQVTEMISILEPQMLRLAKALFNEKPKGKAGDRDFSGMTPKEKVDLGEAREAAADLEETLRNSQETIDPQVKKARNVVEGLLGGVPAQP